MNKELFDTFGSHVKNNSLKNLLTAFMVIKQDYFLQFVWSHPKFKHLYFRGSCGDGQNTVNV